MAKVEQERNGRILAVGILAAPGGEWSVFAIETKADAKNPADVFDDHAHKIIGDYRSPVDAFGAAEAFATAWLGGLPSAQNEPCDCAELDTAVVFDPATGARAS